MISQVRAPKTAAGARAYSLEGMKRMFEIHHKEIQWGGRTLSLETGKIARQADGCVIVKYGDTTVLAAVTAAKQTKPDVDFFPLTVNYVEKSYAAGKIPGGFFKREGRPTEKETLVSRLIDRPIRPLFANGFKRETQVICQVLTHDLENDADIPAIIAASAALTISGMPFLGPIGAAKVGYKDGTFILNPTATELAGSELDLVVSGTKAAVMMVESEAAELPEDTMLNAVMFGHQAMQDVVDLIISLAEDTAKEAWSMPAPVDLSALDKRVCEIGEQGLRAAYEITAKQDRRNAIEEVKGKIHAEFADDEIVTSAQVDDVIKKIEKRVLRGAIIETKKRIDGRDLAQVRAIECEVGILPRTHGSALFTRGETQALVITTLGTGTDEQIVDALDGEYRENFMLHYNFPPYSVGETGRFGFTSRREVGHGKLAWRALRPLLPHKDSFPYTIRTVSEITESNGSSSMASVCGGSLSMMDAGVPLRRPCAGIAMGLIKEGDQFAVLSDILGDEDHLGDMDFKVAGTENGVTSLQMDIKITGITEEIMRVALQQANGGRMHILTKMAEAISGARMQMRDNVPKVTTMNIPVAKIREVIGSGGKVIREICAETDTKIDIEDDGTIKIAATNPEKAAEAEKWIKNIVAEPEVGEIYEGKVVKIMDFGAFVNFIGSRDGLVHISELAQERVRAVGDVVSEGETVHVKVLGIDDRGKVRLSMKVVNQETGKDITEIEADG